MANLIKYTLLLAGDLIFISCVVHFFVNRVCWHIPSKYVDWSTSKREKFEHYAYFWAVLIGLGLAIYGAVLFLFSWMPHRWVSYSEDGDPIWWAELLAGNAAFFGALSLGHYIEKSADAFSKLQNQCTKAETFREIIEDELRQLSFVLRQPEAAADCFKRITKEIDEAEGSWPAPGSEDTKFGVTMGPEVGHGEAEVYTGVQA